MLDLDFDYEEREKILLEKYEKLVKNNCPAPFWAALSIAYVEVFKELRNDYLKELNYPTNDKELNRKLRWDATMLAQIELQEMRGKGDLCGIPW